MNIVDLLRTIIVVTVLLAVAFGALLHFAIRLRRRRRTMPVGERDYDFRYFVRYEPENRAKER